MQDGVYPHMCVSIFHTSTRSCARIQRRQHSIYEKQFHKMMRSKKNPKKTGNNLNQSHTQLKISDEPGDSSSDYNYLSISFNNGS